MFYFFRSCVHHDTLRVSCTMARRSATLGDGTSGKMTGRPFEPANAVKDFCAIMNTTRREFLQASALASLASVAPAHTIAPHAQSSPQEDHHGSTPLNLLAVILW